MGLVLDRVLAMQLFRTDSLAGLYVDPRDDNNLEVFVEREAFLRAAVKVVPGFLGALLESTQALLQNWLECHEQEQFQILGWKLTQNAKGEWHSEQRLDPSTRPLFLSVPRRNLTETFNFYDMVNGGAWRSAPHVRRFRRLNQAIGAWAARFHLPEKWAINAAQCAALVSLPDLGYPFMVVMEATPPVSMNYFEGPFLGNPRLDPTTAGASELAAGVVIPALRWNRRVETANSFLARQRTQLRQEEELAIEKGERKIPRKRKGILPPDLRYTLAAEYQCNGKSFDELEDTYARTGKLKESSDPGVAIQRGVYRLCKLIGLEVRPSNSVPSVR
jgi:hypothetical protein